MPRIKKPVNVNRVGYYIKKEDLLKVVMEYQAKVKECERLGKPYPIQPDTIGRYVMDLCNNLAVRYNFNQYTFKDLMIGDGIEQCVKAIVKFKPEKTDNIFNYFTTVAWRAFQARIIEERKQNAIKHKHYQHTYRVSELSGELIMDASNNDYSNQVIKDYEVKHLNKPITTTTAKKKKKTGLELFMKDNKNDESHDTSDDTG